VNSPSVADSLPEEDRPPTAADESDLDDEDELEEQLEERDGA